VALRGVAVVGGGDWGAELARLAEAGFDGVRLNLIGGHVPDFAEKPGRQFLRACADLKLHVEIQAEGSRWAQILPAIAGTGVRVVIDHLGRIGTLDVMASPGFRAILDALRHTDAWVKCSAPFRSPPGVAAAALRVLLDRAGPHRLVWGSDYPWTQHENGWNFVSGQRWLADAVHDREALAAIAGGNALTLFRFGQVEEGGLGPHPPGGLRPHPPRATGPWIPGLSGRGRQGGGQ
jgi:predicted TIM-barrel fold metal-dependent hydrolase